MLAFVMLVLAVPRPVNICLVSDREFGLDVKSVMNFVWLLVSS